MIDLADRPKVSFWNARQGVEPGEDDNCATRIVIHCRLEGGTGQGGLATRLEGARTTDGEHSLRGPLERCWRLV